VQAARMHGRRQAHDACVHILHTTLLTLQCRVKHTICVRACVPPHRRRVYIVRIHIILAVVRRPVSVPQVLIRERYARWLIRRRTRGWDGPVWYSFMSSFTSNFTTLIAKQPTLCPTLWSASLKTHSHRVKHMVKLQKHGSLPRS
jgi:hypothetical protein